MSVDSSLLGVALIVRSKDGPRFIFHYPPRLKPNERTIRPPYGTELDPTAPEDADDLEPDEDDELDDRDYSLYNSLEGLGLGKKSRHVNPWEGDDHFELPDGQHMVPWEYLDAFHTKDLASILTPARAFHKRCFELTLDPLTFVTYPMHIREDGRWKKKKREKRSRRRKEEEGIQENGSITEDMVISESPAEASGLEDEARKVRLPKGTSFTSDDTNDGGMTMFNLVFIMNPKTTEAPMRVSDMFEHVAKDINKALRYAQNYSNYVWKESERILNLKEKAREERRPMSTLWDTILRKSSLAQTMKTIYTSISSNNIAVVQLLSDPPVRLSVQIPKPYFLSMLPEFDEPSMPGLWITTANFFGDQENEDETTLLSKHFALLLLDDEDKIIADIQSDGGELTGPLLEYLKIVRPTLSFHQTAQQHAISLNDIRILAQHLIYHRRAIAVPPLHPRDTYIVSPNCPMASLPQFCALWSHKFPLAPPLPTFLSALSHAPRPYKTFIPTKTHRPIYTAMLAFLLRHGWATQLRTFAWIIAWPEIKYEVHHDLDGAAIRDAYAKAMEDPKDDSVAATPRTPAPVTSVPAYPHAQAQAVPSTPPNSSEATAEKARIMRLKDKAVQDLADFNAKPKPEATKNPSLNTAQHLVRIQPQLILDPMRAEHVDSMYLAAIAKRLDGEESGAESKDGGASKANTGTAATGPVGKPAAIGSLAQSVGALGTIPKFGRTGADGSGVGGFKKDKKRFLKWAKYFDGKTSIERIALLEGVQRKEVWAQIAAWDEYLLVVKHW
ncbi:Nitrogen permease regulator 3 [Pseudogymnoascus australis]